MSAGTYRKRNAVHCHADRVTQPALACDGMTDDASTADLLALWVARVAERDAAGAALIAAREAVAR